MTMLAPSPPTWTDARIEALRGYAAQGLSAAQIAYRMKPITELAIIGRAARLGIVLGVKPPAALRRGRRAEPLDEHDPMFGIAPPPREDAWRPLPDTDPKPFLDCPQRACMWPIGDLGVTVAHCAAPRPDGLPYCAAHTALAYQGGRYRRSSAFVRQFIAAAARYAR